MALERLMQQTIVCDDGRRVPLVSRQVHWQAIFRILVDRGIYPDGTDYRRTLYWNPDIWTDMQGRSSVTFYNNARTKHIHVRAEGFTRNGEFIVYDSSNNKNSIK